jgi:DNA-binding LacI/PurR family transcriptional regulator
MRDVATLAGVSQPTVSRVLNQKYTTIPISDETRMKVIAAIDALGYRPNMHARSLRTQQTQLIAVLVADITNSFYPQIARSIQQIARHHGYDVMISNSDHVHEYEQHFCETMIRRTVDGIILVPFHLTEFDLHELYRETKTPIAVLGQQINHPQIDVVYGDDEMGVYEVTDWLIHEKKHCRLGYVGVSDVFPPGERRRRGFLRAVEHANIDVQTVCMLESDFTLEGGKQIGQYLLRLDSLPSALVVANDTMALGIMLALQDRGIRIPEDIAIVGYDNIPETTIIRPTLTTLEQNPAEIGTTLVNLLFERIENPDLPSRRIKIPNKLIIRNST